MTAEDYLNKELNGCYQTYTEDGITLISGIEHSEMCEIMDRYKQLSIPLVSQQRELLLAYHRYLTEELSLDLHEIWVDEHLKANNCG